MSAEVFIVVAPIPLLNNASRALLKVPSYGGGITVLGGDIVQGAAGTQSLYLCDMGTAGTAVSGTIITWGSVVFAAGTAQAGSVTTAKVDAGRYIGIKEANVGTTGTVAYVSFSYVMGE